MAAFVVARYVGSKHNVEASAADSLPMATAELGPERG